MNQNSFIKNNSKIYTDGSCNTQFKIGAWAAIIFEGDELITLSHVVENTTNQRMELTAVIESLKYLAKKHTANSTVEIVSDSQYVIHLVDREQKLLHSNYQTKKGTLIQNHDLVQEFFSLTKLFTIKFEKIVAHQKQSKIHNYNIDVDKLARKLVREFVHKHKM